MWPAWPARGTATCVLFGTTNRVCHDAASKLKRSADATRTQQYALLNAHICSEGCLSRCHVCRPDAIDNLVPNRQVTDEEKARLVNAPIKPALMGTLLEFLYRDVHADSVPPLLRLTPAHEAGAAAEEVRAGRAARVRSRCAGAYEAASRTAQSYQSDLRFPTSGFAHSVDS